MCESRRFKLLIRRYYPQCLNGRGTHLQKRHAKIKTGVYDVNDAVICAAEVEQQLGRCRPVRSKQVA